MAQVRCPNCGKSNPADAEVCKFCAAPLKPKAANPAIPTKPVQPGEAPKPQNTADLEPGLPDWLRDLRGDQQDSSQNKSSSGSDDTTSDSAAPAEKGDAVPEWLARIRGRSRSMPNQQPAGEENSPDWMTDDQNQAQTSSKEETEDYFDRLRAFSPADEAESPSLPVKPPVSGTAELFERKEEPGIPEWLSSLGSDEPPAEPAESVKAPDWLANPGQPPSAPAHAVPPDGPSDGEAVAPFDISMPDWLADLDKVSIDENTKVNSAQPSGQTTLSPSSPLVAPSAPPTPPTAPLNEAWPSWLAGLEETPAAPAPVEPPTIQPQTTAPLEDALPNWLASLEETPAAPAPVEPPTIQPQTTAPLEDALPNWLASLEETPAAPAPVEPPTIQPQTTAPLEDALPGWLASLEETPAAPAPAPVEPPTIQPQTTAPLEDAFPSWMSGLEETPATEGAVPPVEIPVEPSPAQFEEVIPIEGELPDWLAGLGGISAEESITPPASSGMPDEISAAQAEMPSENQNLEWLFGRPENPPTGTGPGAQPVEAAGELPEWLTGQSSGESMAAVPAGELPDWLAEAKPEASSLASGAAQENLPPAEEGAMPDWLVGLQSQQQPASWESTPPAVAEEAATEEQGYASPFVSDELPDWLSQIEPSGEEAPEKSTGAAFKEEKEPGGLEPAELPGWVQAMRPIEMSTTAASIPVEVDDRVEKVGPLAGLRGILPAGTLPVDVRKSGFYSIKLQLTDKQRINSASFDSLMAVEAQPQQIEKEIPRLSKNLLNYIVAGLLILAIWLPLWNGGQIMSLPGYILPETSAVQDAVAALPSNSTVLVAVDYEPANVGEMEAASAGVISQLMSKSTNMVLISTNPTGQVLGEQLLTHARDHGQQVDYLIDEKTVNLGYLAGGTAALYNFALYPQLAAPVTADLQNAWEQPVMQNLKHGDNPLANLAQIIVITPDVDTARIWIEQVAPILPNVPFFILTSAQTSPMLKPYLNSGQVKGSVAGITGGTIFERGIGQPSIGHSYWDAYQAGILLLVFLILLGGLVNIADVLINRRKLLKGK